MLVLRWQRGTARMERACRVPAASSLQGRRPWLPMLPDGSPVRTPNSLRSRRTMCRLNFVAGKSLDDSRATKFGSDTDLPMENVAGTLRLT